MRELKFRAWNIDKKEYISDFDISDNGIVWTQKHIDYDPEYPNVIVEQYTGLKDKNDKEIYEGDIVRGHTPYFIANFEIAWRKDKAGWFGFTTDDCTSPLCNIEHLEVIGNIHENKELLEEE